VATYRQAEEHFAAADRKGLLKPAGHVHWRDANIDVAFVYIATHQLEAANRCLVRVLSWPSLLSLDRLTALLGMAAYHKARQKWVNMTEDLKATFPLIQELEKRSDMEPMKVRVFLLLAEAAEGQGDMRLAHEYGNKAKAISSGFDKNLYNPEL